MTEAQLKDPRFHRADLWAVTLDYLPRIPGGADGPAQFRLMSYLLQQYPVGLQPRILRDYAARGYRHFWLSIPDAAGFGVGVDDYVAMAKRVKAAGLIPCHFLRSKDWPISEALLRFYTAQLDAEGLFTHAIHAWEASLFFSPEAYRDTYEGDCRQYPDTLWGHHLQQAYSHFSQDKRPPAEFWEASIAVGNHRLYYQYDSTWSGGMMQARTNDCLVRFVQGGAWGLSRTIEFVPFELVGVPLFNNGRDGDGRIVDEDIANLKNYECLCSPGPSVMAGFGNGCRRPDGSPL